MILPTFPVIRVRTTVSVDIDTAAWIENYGTTPGQLRSDVKSHIENLVREHLNDMGVLARGEES